MQAISEKVQPEVINDLSELMKGLEAEFMFSEENEVRAIADMCVDEKARAEMGIAYLRHVQRNLIKYLDECNELIKRHSRADSQ